MSIHSSLARALSTTVALVAITTTVHADSKRGSFDRAPFHHGKPVAAAFVTTDVLQKDPAKSPALGALLDSIAAEIAATGRSRALSLPVAGAPRVTFGCFSGDLNAKGEMIPEDECDPDVRRMRFAVVDPSKAWREAWKAAAADSLDAVLVFDLSFGQYWVRQQDWKGHKAIELGSGYRAPVAWLTSLDDPVEVLQLSAALVTADGKVVRVASEGLIARRTGMMASMLGAQEILTEDDLATLRERRRDDLPGSPPVWRAAVRALVERLTAKE
jgi:hypothetical protein